MTHAKNYSKNPTASETSFEQLKIGDEVYIYDPQSKGIGSHLRGKITSIYHAGRYAWVDAGRFMVFHTDRIWRVNRKGQ